MLSPKKSGSNSNSKKSGCIPTLKEPREHSGSNNSGASYAEVGHSDTGYSVDDDFARMPATASGPSLKAKNSSTPNSSRQQGSSSWNGQPRKWHSVAEYHARPLRHFRHWKFEPEQAGIWPTIKDLLFTLIVLAGLVVVVNEVLIKLVDQFFLNDLQYFERTVFWTQWMMAVRCLIVMLWVLKVVFDAGTVMGKLEIQRKPILYPRTSFRTS
jgi:hypothetical protein